MEHPLLIAEDDLWSLHIDQLLEPIITVDNPPVEVVEIRSCKPPAIEWNQRPQVRGDNWNHVKNHPLRAIPTLGRVTRVTKSINDFESF